MSTEGNDPRGRGRRLFGSRRRQAEPPAPPIKVFSEPAPVPTPSEVVPVTEADAPASQESEATPEPEATTEPAPAPESAPTPDEDSWTVESVVNGQSEDDAAPAAPGAAEAAVVVQEPTPEVASAAPTSTTPESTPDPAPADPAPADPAPAEPVVKLAPAEGGHVEPRPVSDRPKARSGSVGLPGSAERGRSVDEADAAGGDSEDDEPPTYELPRIIAIANQKGGVGKTTTSVNLGASLAELGYRVLVVDLDPQGNATTGLGINARNLQASVYDVIMTNAAIEDCVEPTSLKNLFVAPATIDLAGAEIELVPAFSRELKLRRALEEVRDEYDYVLIDCPPSLGLLTVNGLAAADDVIVPIQCEYYALEGLSQLIRNVTLVRTNLNPKLDVRGIVLTMYDARTKLADQVEQEVRSHFGRRVYETVVPRTVRLSEAPSFGQPIIVFDSTSRGAVAYRELAKEVSSGATRRAG